MDACVGTIVLSEIQSLVYTHHPIFLFSRVSIQEGRGRGGGGGGTRDLCNRHLESYNILIETYQAYQWSNLILKLLRDFGSPGTSILSLSGDWSYTEIYQPTLNMTPKQVSLMLEYARDCCL